MVYNKYIINCEVIYDVINNELVPYGDKGERVSMNAPTARCLLLLLKSRDKIISREEFLEEVWRTRGVVVSQNTFYQNISLLRKSLASAGLSDDIIVTVRRRGFSLSEQAKVTPVTDSSEICQPERAHGTETTEIIDVPEEHKNDSGNSSSNYLKGRKGSLNNRKALAMLRQGWVLILLTIMTIANVLALFF
jgi:DNA-binding winged helix-turn-helix (wHTH) protein